MRAHFKKNKKYRFYKQSKKWGYSDHFDFPLLPLVWQAKKQKTLTFLVELWHSFYLSFSTCHQCSQSQIILRLVRRKVCHSIKLICCCFGPPGALFFKNPKSDPNSPPWGYSDHLESQKKMGPLGAPKSDEISLYGCY